MLERGECFLLLKKVATTQHESAQNARECDPSDGLVPFTTKTAGVTKGTFGAMLHITEHVVLLAITTTRTVTKTELRERSNWWKHS